MVKPANFLILLVLIVSVLTSGCASTQKFLESRQDKALEVAKARAEFEMNCPDARLRVLSKDVIEPVVRGPVVVGTRRAEFTVGAEGCGKRGTYVVICPENQDGCFAGSRGDVYGTGSGSQGQGR